MKKKQTLKDPVNLKTSDALRVQQLEKKLAEIDKLIGKMVDVLSRQEKI